MNQIDDLQLGKAGEYLVCADLILRGYIAYPSEQGLHYDVIVDVGGKLIRIQVKTTSVYKATPQRKEYTPSYLFNIRRCGNGGRKRYTDKDVDVFALVAIKENVIGYIPIDKIKTTMCFRTKEFTYQTNEKGRYLQDYSFEDAICSK